jgi:hypothetical protein
MNMRIVPLATGLLPIIAIHICYLLGIEYAGLPACIPYLDGCTSISATGRYPPASYLFKAVMMPCSVLLCVYWVLNTAWLRAMDSAVGRSATRHNAISVFGIAGAISLIVYVSFLGTAEPFYEFMRRFGVYLYFLASVIAQLLLAIETMRLSRQTESKSLRRVALAQLFLSISPFIVGILNLVLKAMLEDSDRAENVIEWIFALMMQCFFLLSYFSWKISKFHANFGVGRGPRSR